MIDGSAVGDLAKRLQQLPMGNVAEEAKEGVVDLLARAWTELSGSGTAGRPPGR